MTGLPSGASRPTILVLLSNGFHPDPRVHKEAKTLVEHGYNVVIVCMDRSGDLPTKEVVDGIEIHRTRLGGIRPGEVFSVGLSLASYYLRAGVGILHRFGKGEVNAIHCNDFDTVLLGLALGKRYGVPVVYDMHDQYSSFLKHPIARMAVDRIDAMYCRLVDSIVVVNRDFLGVPFIDSSKTTLVMNVPPVSGEMLSGGREMGLFYAGNFDLGRDIRYAMGVLESSGFPVCLAGDGPLLEDTKRSSRSETTRFLGRIPPEDVYEHTARCVAVLALYDPSYPNNRLASPNKLFDAMKYGKPAIVSDNTVMARIVRENECGLVAEYGDAESLAKAIERLGDQEQYDRMCRNALKAFNRFYNWDVMAPNLLEMYDALTGKSRSFPGSRGEVR